MKIGSAFLLVFAGFFLPACAGNHISGPLAAPLVLGVGQGPPEEAFPEESLIFMRPMRRGRLGSQKTGSLSQRISTRCWYPDTLVGKENLERRFGASLFIMERPLLGLFGRGPSYLNFLIRIFLRSDLENRSIAHRRVVRESFS